MKTVEISNMNKRFGSTIALNNVSFEAYEGEILGLIGENGSGKTSLMNVLVGIYKQDSGKIYVNGEEVEINSPKDAYKYRIGMIHQHFKLVNVFTATENVLLGLTRSDYKQFAKDHDMKFMIVTEQFFP